MTRLQIVALLTIVAVPVLGWAQLPSVDQVKAEASATSATAKQDAASAADVAKKDAGAKADATKQDATTQATGMKENVKVKAKATGKAGVDKGTQKGMKHVKAIVGEERAAAVEAPVKEKGHTGVDKGVDTASEKIESKLK